MVAETAVDMEVHMVADMEVTRWAMWCPTWRLKKRKKMNMEVDKVANMVAGHGCWLIGSKLFRPESLIISLAKGGGKRPSTNLCRVCTHIL